MSRSKRTLGVGGLVGLLATLVLALAVAAPAHAGKNMAVCTFGGEAKMVDKANPNLGVRLVGGKGSFNWSSIIVICMGSSKGQFTVVVGSAEASGVYVSTVCGTGKAWGTVTEVTGAPLKWENLIEGKKFAIHSFGIWQTKVFGTMYWHNSKLPMPFDLKDDVFDFATKLLDDSAKPKSDKQWVAAGGVRIDAPTGKPFQPPSFFTNDCTKAMTVGGVVVIGEN